MDQSKSPRPESVVLLQRAVSAVAQSYAWAAAVVLIILVVLTCLDITFSAFGIYFEDIPLLVSLPIVQVGITWLMGNMSLGFTIHHLVREETRIDLARNWGIAALGCAFLYWH